MAADADYIVVGGGSGGAAVAARLSEHRSHRVLLLEGGGDGAGFLVGMPAGFARMLGDPACDWSYLQSPDASINGRRFIWSGGKMLGGGSSINGLVYIRGSRDDFDRWVKLGCTGWSFGECLPYFMRSECFDGPANQVHGQMGPLHVMPAKDPHPLSRTFLAACAERGLPTLDEYCGGEMDGAFLSLTTQEKGVRSSTARSYLRDARGRDNLDIRTGVVAERIIFEGKRAVGVEIQTAEGARTLHAAKEIIVCCGAMGTPALLLRSGVGPAEDLKALGIEVVADRREVGANLQEHPSIGVNKFVTVPTYNSQMSPVDLAWGMLNYLLFKRGPMSNPAVQAMALIKTLPTLEAADVQLHFYPVAYDIEPDTLCSATATLPKEPTVTIGATLAHPKSRGHVRLAGKSASVLPEIRHELLGDASDVATLVRACKIIDAIFAADAWKGTIKGARSPGPSPTDAEWEAHVRSRASIAYHPVGTCRMGSDGDAVVSTKLVVNGVSGLRIADASVMPELISVNTNATSIMIGERCADFVLQAG